MTAFSDRLSANFDPRPGNTPVDMLVLHYTGMKTMGEALGRLLDPDAKVSAHWLIDEDGTIYRLVDESERAWHAGVAHWRGETDVNGRSVGIELVNPGHDFGYRPFPERQMAALTELAREILSRHPIPARNVVGHSDVAPTRKADPGELFDWSRLAAHGVGLWPGDWEATETSGEGFLQMLASYGYDIADPDAAARAFQRHFRPGCIDGEADAHTAGLLAALLAMAG